MTKQQQKSFGEDQGKKYDYILENRCIYCGVFPKPGEMFALDHESDKVCREHERKLKNQSTYQKIISNLQL